MNWTKTAAGMALFVAAAAHGLPAAGASPSEQAAIERDWRMQDGIGTPRAPSSYQAAIERLLDRGDRLIADLHAAGLALESETAEWKQCRARWKELSAIPAV
ncbi:unnamed protein product, partial [marine sediment metagenome]